MFCQTLLLSLTWPLAFILLHHIHIPTIWWHATELGAIDLGIIEAVPVGGRQNP